MNDKVTTADRLHEIMTEQNLKQADIIERAKPYSRLYGVKLTRPDLSQYCSGKVIPSQYKLLVLAAALRVNEAWLMGYDVPRQIDRDTIKAMYLAGSEWKEKAYPGITTTPTTMWYLTDDEAELIQGYRAALDDRKVDMLDMARKALSKKEKGKSSDFTFRGTA